MAKLYLTEFVTAGRDHGATNAAADTGSWTENANSPIPTTSGNISAPFGANTTLIRLNTDSTCTIQIVSLSGTIVSNQTLLRSDATEYFAVHPGQILSVAGGSPFAPPNGYILEDGTTFYVAEDGTTFYVQET